MHSGTEDVAFGDLPPGRHAMAVMGQSGDTKLQWDPNVIVEVEAARRQFEFLTKEKKYAAFRMNERGDRGEMIREFDPQAARIIMAPQFIGG